MNSSRQGAPFLYYLLAALTATGTILCFHGLFREYTLFFGAHVVSTTTIFVSGLLCMSLGFYVAGKLANKTSRPMIFFMVFQAVTGIFGLFQPFVFEWLVSLFDRINQSKEAGPLGVEMMRFIISFAMLLFPMSLLSGSIPMLIRHYIKHVSHSGRYMSAAILSGSIGTIAGLLLILTLLVPKFGFQSLHLAATMVNVFAAFLAIYLLSGNLSKSGIIGVSAKSEKVKRAALRFKKKKPVLETNIKLTKALLKVYSFQGFTISAMIFLCFRILSMHTEIGPFYSFTLSVVIMLVGLLTGSALYRKISEQPVNKFMTLATLQILTGFGYILSYILISILAASSASQLQDIKLNSNMLLKQVSLTSLLVFIPALLNGLSLPLAGKLFPKRMQKIGSAFGRLGSAFFLSSVAGILVVPFLMMPFFGVQLTYLFIAFLTLLSGIYLIFRDSRLIRLFRLSYALLAILLFVLMAGAFHFSRSGWTASATEKKIEGYAASLSTQMNADSTKSVLLNGNYFFGTDQRSLKAQLLPAYLSLLINQNIHSALVIGFGTGLTASTLEERGAREIQITDMYPEVIRLSSAVFADENNDIMTNHHVKISVEDGRAYLIRLNSNVDLIVSGYGLFKQMPSLYTSEFYQLCAKKLSDQGLLCQILPIKEISSKTIKALIKSCSIAFSTVNLWYVSPEHVLMLASNNQINIDFCALSAAFLAMNADKSFTGIGIPNVETLLAHSLLGGNQVSRLCKNITENTDNKPLTIFSIVSDKEKEDDLLMEFNQTKADVELPVIFSKGCMADSLSTYKQIRKINQRLLQQDGLSSGLQF